MRKLYIDDNMNSRMESGYCLMIACVVVVVVENPGSWELKPYTYLTEWWLQSTILYFNNSIHSLLIFKVGNHAKNASRNNYYFLNELHTLIDRIKKMLLVYQFIEIYNEMELNGEVLNFEKMKKNDIIEYYI